ncbi:MAG: hypothetical protein ACRDTV_22710, partial [Mycobacterium sp.]
VQPIQGAVANTPEDLLNAPSTPLIGELPNGMWPYGPTITAIEQVGGQEIVTMRISTFGPDGLPYDPHTYTTTIAVVPPP